MIAATAVFWAIRSGRVGADRPHPELIRLSPADDHSYGQATISPDGKFVAYRSDRGSTGSGVKQIWLQQVGGGAPVPLTHEEGDVDSPGISVDLLSSEFSPDGTQILYLSKSGNTYNIEIIPTLGGQPRELVQGAFGSRFSPDGRSVAYISLAGDAGQLMTIPVSGGQPRRVQAIRSGSGLLWVDDHHLLFAGALFPGARDWYIIPIDGGATIALGAARVFEKSGFNSFFPSARAGERVLFSAGKGDQTNVWAIGLHKNPWRLSGPPRQLTFGTEKERATSVSVTGMAAINISSSSSDLYFAPMNTTVGEITGPTRRLTRDSREKGAVDLTGNSSLFKFGVIRPSNTLSYLLRDLDSGRETMLLTRSWQDREYVLVTDTGKQALIVQKDGPSYAMSLRNLDLTPATEPDRIVCRHCGLPTEFTPDLRWVFYDPGALVLDDPKRKQSIHVLDLSTGKGRPWLSHPKYSVRVSVTVGEKSDWLWINAWLPGDGKQRRSYLVPWREQGPPESEWIDVSNIGPGAHSTNGSNLIYTSQGNNLMARRFDPQKRSLESAPFPVKSFPGSELRPLASDAWDVGGRGIVFTHTERRGSIWLMKLPD